MVENGKDKPIQFTNSSTGVVGDNTKISGGIHYHQAPPQSESATQNSNQESNPPLEQQIQDYCKKAEALHEKLPLFGFKTRLKVPIDIADIYVPLRAMIDLRATGPSCFADAEDAENCLRKQGVDREISVPNAFREAEKMTPLRRGIVILGDPGSGKTTHMKRILLWCLRGGLRQIGLPEDMIPVFLPLRELKDVDCLSKRQGQPEGPYESSRFCRAL